MEPQLIPEHPLPDTLQITTPLAGPLAVNCNCAPGFTCAELGVTPICEEEAAATMVAIALDDLLGAATDTAVIVILGEAGMLDGDVYRPEDGIDHRSDHV